MHDDEANDVIGHTGNLTAIDVRRQQKRSPNEVPEILDKFTFDANQLDIRLY